MLCFRCLSLAGGMLRYILGIFGARPISCRFVNCPVALLAGWGSRAVPSPSRFGLYTAIDLEFFIGIKQRAVAGLVVAKHGVLYLMLRQAGEYS